MLRHRRRGIGVEQSANRRLVQCLQADRRVDIELFGVRPASFTRSR